MSDRGWRLYVGYVDRQLLDPTHAALNPKDHAERLVAQAHAAGIPILEITEEVGPVADALAVARNLARMRRG
jgi:branched-subunit amino acid aminotransferase/4-amino-4-deoxychorismate lyase